MTRKVTMNMLRLCLGVLLLAIVLEAGMSCKKRAKKFNKCLENGYSPKIFTNCQAEGEAMTAKRKIKKCTRAEKKFSKLCDTDSLECQSNEWTPIFNATTSKFGPLEGSKVPDFIVKFTQEKEVDKSLYYSQEVRLYNAAGERIGSTNFIQYARIKEGQFTVNAYKRYYITGANSCQSRYLTLDYLTDYNFEMRTSATQANMYQFTTSDGVVHNEDMSYCNNYSAWQDVLSRTEYADMKMYTSTGSDIADYVTAEYKVEEN